MEVVTEKDFFEVIKTEKMSSVDQDIIFDLYQPLIGFKAASVYFSLFSLADESFEQQSHNYIFSKMQIAPGEFVLARRCLEAVGLLKTYLKNNSSPKIYCYELYKPLGAREFFNDFLFKGLLVKYLGEKKVNELVFKYISPEIDKNEYTNVSASFKDVFNFNLDDNAFLNNIRIKNKAGSVTFDINTKEIDKLLLDTYHIIQNNLPTKKEYEEIKRIATLFNLNEIRIASLLFGVYDASKDNHYDLKRLVKNAGEESTYGVNIKSDKKSEINNDSLLAKKIDMMESLSPYSFFKIVQGNIEPSPADMGIVNDISAKYRLNNGVINALIDYVLVIKENDFPRSYVEKLAATLARNKIETSLDAMNYLNRKRKTTKKIIDNSDDTKTNNDENVEESFDDLLKKLDEI